MRGASAVGDEGAGEAIDHAVEFQNERLHFDFRHVAECDAEPEVRFQLRGRSGGYPQEVAELAGRAAAPTSPMLAGAARQAGSVSRNNSFRGYRSVTS